MLRTLTALSALIAAVSLVTLANATMTTVMPLRLLQDGASEAVVALFGAAYFAGFAVGCFSQPPRILRIGYIRAFAAAAAICTSLAIIMDLTDRPGLWIALRFGMGLSIAAIFASVDGWINAVTPDNLRGKVFAVYSWCIGASAVFGQALLLVTDGLAVGFVTVLALAFNLAVTLVTLTRASAPSVADDAEPGPAISGGVLVVTSGTAVMAAVYAGLVVSAILTVLPAGLALRGVGDNVVGAVIGSYFLGRLVLQIPMGMIADRMDLRLLVAIVAAATGAVTLLGSVLILAEVATVAEDASMIAKVLFLAIAALLGGLTLPVYTLANSLAFARAAGRPAVKIATTLLLVNAAGAVAGPLLVAGASPFLGRHALPAVVVVASAALAAFALYRKVAVAPHQHPATARSEIPATSVALAEQIGEVRSEAQAEAEEEAEAVQESRTDTDGADEPKTRTQAEAADA